jgi:hypothetical protein
VIVLRQPPYDSFVSYTLEPSKEYRVLIKDDDRNDTVLEDFFTTNTAGLLILNWQGTYNEKTYDFTKYDKSYHLEVSDLNDVVLEDTIAVERPYVNPNTYATTASDVVAATQNERLARAMIDAITGGFYFKTTWIETTGQGTDYLPIWERLYKILKVYENSELVYDTSLETPIMGEWEYLITRDKTAIIKDPAYRIKDYNRSESKPVGLNIANSDSISMFDTSDSGNTIALKAGVVFNGGTDYIVYGESGYKVVPADITDATKMLMYDIECGKLEYFKRYIIDYSTDQFKIKMDSSALAGTGNILVDKILNKYINDVRKPGVL